MGRLTLRVDSWPIASGSSVRVIDPRGTEWMLSADAFGRLKVSLVNDRAGLTAMVNVQPDSGNSIFLVADSDDYRKEVRRKVSAKKK